MTRLTHIPLRWPASWPRATRIRDANFSGDRTLTQAVRALAEELTRKDETGFPFAYAVTITCADGTATPNRSADPAASVWFSRRGIDTPFVLACDKWSYPAHNVWALVQHVKALRGQERWGVGTTAQAFAGYVALNASPDAAPYVPPEAKAWSAAMDEPSTPREKVPCPVNPNGAHHYQPLAAFSINRRISICACWRVSDRVGSGGREPTIEEACAPRGWRLVLGFRQHTMPSASDIEVAFKTLALKHHPDKGGSTALMQLLNAARDDALAKTSSRFRARQSA
jgi:hypothetical protein